MIFDWQQDPGYYTAGARGFVFPVSYVVAGGPVPIAVTALSDWVSITYAPVTRMIDADATSSWFTSTYGRLVITHELATVCDWVTSTSGPVLYGEQFGPIRRPSYAPRRVVYDYLEADQEQAAVEIELPRTAREVD